MKKDCMVNMPKGNKAKCYHRLNLGGMIYFYFKILFIFVFCNLCNAIQDPIFTMNIYYFKIMS